MADQAKSKKKASPRRKSTTPLPAQEWFEPMFMEFLDSIDVGVYVLDLKGVITRVNRYILDHYQWEMKELAGQNIFELMPDLIDMGVEEKFRQIIRERRTTELTNLERKDRIGRTVVFNLKGVPILEGNEVKGVFAVMSDITEKRALEHQMAETENYLQSLIDNANDIIYTLDCEGRITFLNKMGQEITGYRFDPDEKAHYTAYVVKRDLEKNERYFRKALKGHPQRYESTIVGIDGRLINVLINITPIWRLGKVVGMLGIARDITERKQMEAQLLQASKMAAIGELAAGVAHEINNPVGVIIGSAEQLQFLMEHYRDRPEEVPARLSKHVETISEQAARCKKITQSLLNFGRKVEMRTAEVNIPRLLEETTALVASRAASEGKRVEIRMPPDFPMLNTDPNQLEQVFLNLVTNALDAVGSGGTVTIAARIQDDSAVIDVADNGVGISEENLKKVFDPFFTTKPLGKGTGLGLSVCFGIVQRMNGTISVRSTPGGGTTFSVRLPLNEKRQRQSK